MDRIKLFQVIHPNRPMPVLRTTIPRIAEQVCRELNRGEDIYIVDSFYEFTDNWSGIPTELNPCV